MREIDLPPAYNKRANDMWDIIEPAVSFGGKTVLDLGCGYGDMLWRAWRAGASRVLGIDADDDACHTVQHIITRSGWGRGDSFWAAPFDINKLDPKAPHKDIVICFSVLPYLDDPDATLHWIREHSIVALLEVQYAGDGPGFVHIRDDNDMRGWLLDVGWQRVESLGRTYTRIRNAWRTIWRCE